MNKRTNLLRKLDALSDGKVEFKLKDLSKAAIKPTPKGYFEPEKDFEISVPDRTRAIKHGGVDIIALWKTKGGKPFTAIYLKKDIDVFKSLGGKVKAKFTDFKINGVDFYTQHN